jgi:hypothetical protein
MNKLTLSLKNTAPVIISSATCLIFLVLYFFRFHYGLSFEQGDWSSFGSYIGGILTPIISITGFYYVVLSIKNTSEERKIDNIKTIIEKTENETDNILNRVVFIEFLESAKMQSHTILSLLRFSKTSKIYRIYLDIERQMPIQLFKEVNDIRSNLQFIMIRLMELMKTRIDESEVQNEYYKRKYSSLVTYLSNTDLYYYATKIEVWDKESDDGSEKRLITDNIREYFK